MYLLDTNVISEMRKMASGRTHPQLSAWVQSVPASALFTSVLCLLELERGALQVRKRDAAQPDFLLQWIELRVRPAFAGRVLPVSELIAQQCAPLHIPDPKPEMDALIAATALVHGLVVVSRNTSDFAFKGLQVLNPWLPQ
jgi:toxin FitB